eukprot:TRINITY_DN2_c0_g1_i3.p1 TRINITY_DN2_c0_g1~~TRINITY_DN2_c0_g1_i3.p1  ORF type:complete len:289 (-),score=65.14 TRINITY_DN2_c0_g1_i3:50-916(-)
MLSMSHKKAALVCQWIRAFRRCMPTADVTTGMVEFIQSFADELQPLAAALVADGWWASRWHCSPNTPVRKQPPCGEAVNRLALLFRDEQLTQTPCTPGTISAEGSSDAITVVEPALHEHAAKKRKVEIGKPAAIMTLPRKKQQPQAMELVLVSHKQPQATLNTHTNPNHGPYGLKPTTHPATIPASAVPPHQSVHPVSNLLYVVALPMVEEELAAWKDKYAKLAHAVESDTLAQRLNVVLVQLCTAQHTMRQLNCELEEARQTARHWQRTANACIQECSRVHAKQKQR